MSTPIKTSIYLLLGILLFAAPLNAQTKRSGISVDDAMKKFPGFTTQQMQQLFKAKKYYPIPLPTWVPAGFKVDKIVTKVTPDVALENQELKITYSKELPGGKEQTFTIDAGIDGIGDIPYDGSQVVKSTFGDIYLFYQPKDWDKKLKTYVITEWFLCDSTNYHYASVASVQKNPKNFSMLSLADTRKIIGSLQKLPKD